MTTMMMHKTIATLLYSLSVSLVAPSTFFFADAQHSDYQPHYLVGLLSLPNSTVSDNHTSGTYLIQEPDEDWRAWSAAPFSYVPGVGFSDIEFYYDADGNRVTGEFYCLSDNGYGGVFEENSADYPLNIQHIRIQKPFTYGHGESTFDAYTDAVQLGIALLRDPNGYIQWENGADIQVVYKIPDSTWDDYKEMRVLTGRDIDPEGLAVIHQECAVVGDEHMPAVFMVNPKTGVVLSPFVRTPDIGPGGEFNGNFLSTTRDKVHCSIADLEQDACPGVNSSVVDDNGYRRVDKSGGYEGFARLHDGSIAAFIEKQDGDTTLEQEPGVRVYRVVPGNCTPGSAPVFDSFYGFYPLELNAVKVADVSTIPGSSSSVVVLERNGFPKGHLFPAPEMPANKLCVVDLTDVDDNRVLQNKRCILNYHNIDDPWDVDGNGILKYALTQVTNEAVIVVDDYCIVAATDINYPWTNQFQLNESEVEHWQEVSDSRFMVVCFVEPLFNVKHPFLQDPGGDKEEPVVTAMSSSSAPTKTVGGSILFYGCIIIQVFLLVTSF